MDLFTRSAYYSGQRATRGVVLVSSLALGTALACRRAADQQTSADRRVETEADIIDGDAPLFI